MKLKTPLFVWGVCLALFVLSVFVLGASLPERVATHFGASGQADGWMSRSKHMIAFSLFGVGFSGFVIGICYVIRFLPPTVLNVPRPDYWRSPEHFREACEFMFRHSFWFGAMTSAWLAVLHYLLVQANRKPVPALDAKAVWGLTLAFLAGTAVWVLSMVRFLARTGRTESA